MRVEQRAPSTDRSVARSALALALVATIGAGCEREQRRFRGPPANAASYLPWRLTDQEAGTMHAVGKSPPPEDALAGRKPAEENAFAVNEGSRLFRQFNCVGCHANGGGGIGPPLLDDRWRYGSEPRDIVLSIVAGRPNGMPSFGARVSHDQAEHLAAYVRSLSGLVRIDVAPGRRDALQTAPAPNTKDRETPRPEEPR